MREILSGSFKHVPMLYTPLLMLGQMSKELGNRSLLKKAYRKLPLGLQKKVRKYYKLAKGEYEFSRRPVSKKEIVQNLRDLGVRPSDIIYVQSSLKSIGRVRGGPETVIDALIESVGQRGIVAMPTFTIPVGGMKETLERNEVFDPASTPSTVGLITDTFRKRPGVQRSIHPTSSIAAYGTKAQELVEGHRTASSNFGLDTPYWRVIEWGGKTIGIGVELDKVSFYHTAEDVIDPFPIRVYMDKIYEAKVKERGKVHTMQVRPLDPAVSRTRIDIIPEGNWIRNFVTEYLIDRGVLHYGYIGDSKSWIMAAKEFFSAYEELVGNGITIYTTEDEYKSMGKKLISYVRNHRSAFSDKKHDYLSEQARQVVKDCKHEGFWNPEDGNWIRQLNWNGEVWTDCVPHDWKYAIEMQEGATFYAIETGDSMLDGFLEAELRFIRSKVKPNGEIEGIPDGYSFTSEEYEYGATLSALALGSLYFKDKKPELSDDILKDTDRVYDNMSSRFAPDFEDHWSVVLRGYANLYGAYRMEGRREELPKLKAQIDAYASEFIKNQRKDGLFPFSPKEYETAVQCQLKAVIALLLSYRATSNKDHLNAAKKNFDWVVDNLLLPSGGLKWNVDNSKNFFEIHQMLFLISSKYLTDISNGKWDYTPKAISAWKFLLDRNPADIDMYVHNLKNTGAFFSYRCVDSNGEVQSLERFGQFKGSYEIGYMLWGLALNRDLSI
jgi:aminoglycoside 3-N-acetyltransferase